MVGVTVDDKGLDRLRVALRDLSATEVFVGILASGKANEAHKDEDGNDTVATQQDVGTWMEFGTGHVPERSFLRETIAVKRNEIETRLAAEVRKVLTGKQGVDAAMEHVGQFVVGLCQARIKEGIGPELDQSTIDRKGSSTPLIDTGQLRSSITYEVRR